MKRSRALRPAIVSPKTLLLLVVPILSEILAIMVNVVPVGVDVATVMM
jgi:hypothetical protein